jgi:hypothetical protein
MPVLSEGMVSAMLHALCKDKVGVVLAPTRIVFDLMCENCKTVANTELPLVEHYAVTYFRDILVIGMELPSSHPLLDTVTAWRDSDIDMPPCPMAEPRPQDGDIFELALWKVRMEEWLEVVNPAIASLIANSKPLARATIQ